MKGLWIVGLAAILLAGCSPKAEEGDAKAPDTKGAATKTGGADGTGPISIPGAKPTFVAVTEIFNKRCTGCHGGTGKSAAGYDLTSYDSVMKGGRSGAAIVAGDDAKSLLVAYLTGEKTPRMPKNGAPLDPADIDVIKAWIKAGAKNE